MSPKGHHGRHAKKIREWGYNLMNSYVFMDQEFTNRPLLLDFWRLLPEMVVTTMFPKGHHGRHAKKIRVWGYNLMHKYVIMD